MSPEFIQILNNKDIFSSGMGLIPTVGDLLDLEKSHIYSIGLIILRMFL